MNNSKNVNKINSKNQVNISETHKILKNNIQTKKSDIKKLCLKLDKT
jgi:hypothetical protein